MGRHRRLAGEFRIGLSDPVHTLGERLLEVRRKSTRH